MAVGHQYYFSIYADTVSTGKEIRMFPILVCSAIPHIKIVSGFCQFYLYSIYNFLDVLILCIRLYKPKAWNAKVMILLVDKGMYNGETAAVCKILGIHNIDG